MAAGAELERGLLEENARPLQGMMILGGHQKLLDCSSKLKGLKNLLLWSKLRDAKRRRHRAGKKSA